MNKDEFSARLQEILPLMGIKAELPRPKVRGLGRLYLRTYQHDETGRTVILPFWKNPGRRWHQVHG